MEKNCAQGKGGKMEKEEKEEKEEARMEHLQ